MLNTERYALEINPRLVRWAEGGVGGRIERYLKRLDPPAGRRDGDKNEKKRQMNDGEYRIEKRLGWMRRAGGVVRGDEMVRFYKIAR